MLERSIISKLHDLAKQYSVVSVLGPRQSGKTTIVKSVFVGKPYVNLEAPDIRLLAQTDPRSFLAAYPDGVILDEVQRVPDLLSYIQTLLDEERVPGKYVLTGSHQLELHQALSQSLAGRVGILKLYPLTLHELRNAGFDLDLDTQLYQGFYPGIYDQHLNPTEAYDFYVQTYLEKDVRQLSAIKNLTNFQRFMKLCAGRIGCILDYSSLSNELGVAVNTIKHWFAVLEASYLIILLKPYYENFGKRVIKAPKLYFTDVGLVSYLLDIETPQQIARDPLRGNLFENFIVMELYKYYCNYGRTPHLYYYRDSNQNEIDVLIKKGQRFIPIEIKSAQTFQKSFLKGINYFNALVNERVQQSYVIYAGPIEQMVNDIEIINYKKIAKIYHSHLEM